MATKTKAAAKGKPPRKARIGRPRTPPGEALVSYGLHLSRDKRDKLFELKVDAGMSVRGVIEEMIEYAYDRMLRRREAAG